MKVHLKPDGPAKLSRIDSQYDDWFSQEVDKGLAAAEQGQFVEHEAVRELIDRRYPG